MGMGECVMWVGIGPNLTLCVFVNLLHFITEAGTHWIVSLPILTVFLRILCFFFLSTEIIGGFYVAVGI